MFSTRLRPSAPGKRMDPIRRRKLLFSYLPDWVLTIVLAAAFFALDKVPGFKRSFSVDEKSISHTYAVHERVPNIGLYFIAVVAPFVLQAVINIFTIRSLWDFHNSTLGLILGLSLTGAVTQFVKITVGRPRPDLLDRCQLKSGTVDPTYGLTTVQACTQTDEAILRDGFRSFPSGHSSLSFAGLGFLTFYLAGKLHLFDQRGHAGKAWLSLLPLSGAALVAISRTMDYRHHWQDVLIGSVLGLTLSYFTYRQYYPSLASATSHRPYSPRIKADEGGQGLLPTHNQHPSLQIPNQYQDHHQEDEVELEGSALGGTVLRPDIGSMHNVWKDREAATPPQTSRSIDRGALEPTAKPPPGPVMNEWRERDEASHSTLNDQQNALR